MLDCEAAELFCGLSSSGGGEEDWVYSSGVNCSFNNTSHPVLVLVCENADYRSVIGGVLVVNVHQQPNLHTSVIRPPPSGCPPLQSGCFLCCCWRRRWCKLSRERAGGEMKSWWTILKKSALRHLLSTLIESPVQHAASFSAPLRREVRTVRVEAVTLRGSWFVLCCSFVLLWLVVTFYILLTCVPWLLPTPVSHPQFPASLHLQLRPSSVQFVFSLCRPSRIHYLNLTHI